MLEEPGKAHIYVDDALMATRNRERMEMALDVALEAIFTVISKSHTKLRQYTVAMDK